MDNLDRLLALSFEEYGEYFIDESEIDAAPHIFSAEFEQKMELMLNSRTHRRVKITPKIAVSLFIAAVLAAMFATATVSAVEERMSQIKLSEMQGGRFTVLQIERFEQQERDYGDGYFLRENGYGFELILHEDTTQQSDVPFYASYRRSLYENNYAVLEIWEDAPVSNLEKKIISDDGNELIRINGNDVYFVNYANIEIPTDEIYSISYYYPENSGMTLIWDDGGHFVELSVKNKDNGNYDKNDIINLFNFVHKAE